MRAKICGEPGCSALVPPTQTYCAAHAREPRKPFANAVRHNAEFYNTARWRKLRAEVLERQPCCIRCGASRSGLHVHHLVPPRGDEFAFFDAGNLTVLCGSCHRLETAGETRAKHRCQRC